MMPKEQGRQYLTMMIDAIVSESEWKHRKMKTKESHSDES
jgi:hypothetical protein